MIVVAIVVRIVMAIVVMIVVMIVDGMTGWREIGEMSSKETGNVHSAKIKDIREGTVGHCGWT